ncbi:MAG: HNH endonuclease [Anaerolineaceae bacterium]|nr:MAG: HNH endonuclease [Anaerolineaceae bacterium]
MSVVCCTRIALFSIITVVHITAVKRPLTHTPPPEGQPVVEAAHIIPWRISHNDDPRNGLALCRLCHWTFDEGMLAVSSDYLVNASPRLRAEYLLS